MTRDQRAGSVRALIDARERAEHTLVRIDVAAPSESQASEALRAAADPDEPIGFGCTSITQLVPPIDARNERNPLRFWIPATVLALVVAMAALSSTLGRRPEFAAVQAALEAAPSLPAALWIGAGAFVLANVALFPLEVVSIAAGVAFGAVHGGLVALLGSLVVSTAGYLAGRAIGPAGLTRWMSRRSYQSARQLGARGVVGVIVLRLASVASAGSVHLLCGAGRVPFATYLIGTVIGLTPVIAAISGLGGLLRQALLQPSVENAAITVAAGLLLLAFAAALRAFLLIRQFAPSVSLHRDRAEFG